MKGSRLNTERYQHVGENKRVFLFLAVNVTVGA